MIVRSEEELRAALANDDEIVVEGALEVSGSVTLPPGRAISGGSNGAALRFPDDGLQLTADNQVRTLRVETQPTARAIWNDTTVADLGTMRLQDVVALGCVEILAAEAVRGGHVDVAGLHVEAADARERSPRPANYGVEVLPGAITIWNRHEDSAIEITAHLIGLSAGSAEAPVRGSGIFVGGGGDQGGRMTVDRLETGEVHSDGGLAPGTADRITGGVFLIHGGHADEVINRGPVTTYGVNDMVLDNWGTATRWVAEDAITSHGPSGIGFVNFGTIQQLVIKAPIVTHGIGARGFNIYDGTVEDAEFQRIETHADAAVGIQISQPFGRIVVHDGVVTHGGEGDSLVKGVITNLAAVPISLKPGAHGRELRVDGGVTALSPGIAPLEIHGDLDAMTINGGITATE